MAEKTKNTIVVLEPCAKSAKDLLAMAEEKSLADVVRVPSVEEALQLIAQSLPCIFVASINDNNDVPTRVQLFKRLEGAIKQQGLKIFVVTPLKNRQLSDMVTQKLGVADYIVEPIPARTMQFKLNLQLKAVDNFRRQMELKKAAAEAVVIKKLDPSKKQDAAAGNEVKTNGKPALQAGEDTFLFKNSGVKKTGKKYTVELEGPAPETGEWVPHEDKGDPTPAWRWVPNEEKEAQAKGEIPPDGWVHKGDKPQFVNESQKWAMTSEKPSLALRKRGAVAAEKVGTDQAGEVFVAEDSPAAVENIAKNRARAALLKPKRSKSLKDSLGGLEAPDGETDTTGGEPAEEGDAADPKRRRLKNGKAGSKLDAMKSLMSGDDEDASAGELVNKLTPDELGKAAELKDKRGNPDPASAFNALKDGEAEEPGDAPKGALAFLQKKKEEQKRAEAARIKGDPLPEGVDPLEDGEEEDDDPALPRGLKKKKAKPKNSAMDRLAQSLAEGVEQPEEANESSLTEEEREEEVAEPSSPKALRANKLKQARDPLASLRDDPASERADVNDQQDKGAKREKLRAERKKSVATMQALLEEPLPESMAPAEEEALRAELGLKDRPDIPVKDLARKKRLKTAKALKNRLAELSAELTEEEEIGEAIQGAVSQGDPEAAERTTGDLGSDKLRGIRSAIDNEQSAEELEEERKRIKSKHEVDRKKAANKDKAVYIPEAEIQPSGNAWEHAGEHFVYLGSTVRYRGFGKLEDLLPLWYFSGDDAPVLLDKTKQWRFLGGRPEQAKTVAEIPAPVRDFLISLRDQLLTGVATEEREAAGDESSEGDGRKRKGKSAEDSKFDKLKSMLGDEDDSGDSDDYSADAEPLGAEKQGREGQEDTHDKNDLRKKKSRSAETTGAFEGGDQTEEDEATEFEGKDPERDSGKASAENSEDPLARLRAKLAAREETEPEEPKDSYSAKLAEQPSLQSEGVKKFLEKRKQKAEAALATETTANKAQPSGYLGVFVTLSDAYANQAKPSLALCRVLGAMQDSFKNCIVYCTGVPESDGMAEVRYHSPQVAKPNERIALSGGLSEPVQRATGGESEVLGYLYIGKQGARDSFTDAEEITFRSMAAKLWPLLSQAIIAGDKDAA